MLNVSADCVNIALKLVHGKYRYDSTKQLGYNCFTKSTVLAPKYMSFRKNLKACLFNEVFPI